MSGGTSVGPAPTVENVCEICGKDPPCKNPHDGEGGRQPVSDKQDITGLYKKDHPWELLNRDIKVYWYYDGEKEDQPYTYYEKEFAYYGKFKDDGEDKEVHSTIQPHHLIPCEIAAKDEVNVHNGKKMKLGEVCRIMGYDINRSENLAHLPSYTEICCHLKVPLHSGPHPGGWKVLLGKIKKIVDCTSYETIKTKVTNGDYCTNTPAFTEDMDNLSKKILDKILKFEILLTKDGKDYKDVPNTKGCGNSEVKIRKKDDKCMCGGVHFPDPKDKTNNLHEDFEEFKETLKNAAK